MALRRLSFLSAVAATGARTWATPDSLAGRVLTTALHAALWLALASTLYGIGLLHVVPLSAAARATDGLQWDAGWFASIARQGYYYVADGQSNVPFFPLFPLIWRWTGLSPTGIVVLNAAVFLAAFTGLAQVLRLSRRWMLLGLSVPSAMFMVVPYSEAWFFLFGALLLIGLHRSQTSWVLLGLLGCGLTRSASALFTPALLFTAGAVLAQGQFRRALLWGGGGLAALAVSLALVLAYQTSFPGVPADGFAESHAAWGHELGWPQWPFYSDAGVGVLWYSAVALALSLAAGAGCAFLAGRYAWARLGGPPAPVVSPAVLFALGYCFAALLFVLAFQGGKLAGLHRYVFNSPFFVVLLWQLSQWPAWRARTYGLVVVGLLAVWQLCGAWGRLPNFTFVEGAWYFGLTTLYALAWPASRPGRGYREISAVLYIFNILYQLYLLDIFLRLGWIE